MTEPPIIKPIAKDENTPVWSVMVPVYNCAHLLPGTLSSILIQDPGIDRMQIEVIDDASTDGDVKRMVETIGNGRITYYKQNENVGILKNFETCLNRSKGRYIHILHADDTMRQGYYKKMEELFDLYPQAGAAFSHYDYINDKGEIMWKHLPHSSEEGIIKNWLLKIAHKQLLQYCSISVKREVYEKIGGFFGVSYGEDWEMWTRIAKKYPVAYTPQSLACYRMHAKSVSHQVFQTGKNLDDIKWVINAIQKHIPVEERDRIRNMSYKHYAHYALTIANSLWHQTYDKRITKLQIKGALQMHKDISMILPIARLYAKMMLKWKGKSEHFG